MAKEVAVSRQAKMISLIEERAEEFGRALPRHIPSDKFVRVLKTAIGQQPDLAECDPKLLLVECQKIAADGLVADGREATIIVFNQKARNKNDKGQWVEEWRKTPKYIPMYQGLIRRARNSGELKAIGAMLVYAEELKVDKALKKPRFSLWVDTTGKHVEHHPILSGKRGAVAGAYSIATMKDGLVDFHWMDIERLRVIQGRSRGKRKNKDTGAEEVVGPWKTDEEEMMKKTVIRAHSKTLPLDSDLSRVFSRDDDLYEPEPKPVNPEAAGKARGLAATRLNGEDEEVTEAEVIEDDPPKEPTTVKIKPKPAAKGKDKAEEAPQGPDPF